MAEEAPLPVPARAEATEPGCCEISATEPAPLTSLVASASGSQTAVPAPVMLAGVSAPPVSAAVTPPEPLPRATASSLSLLYCVLLI